MKKIWKIAGVCFVIYILSYTSFRFLNIEKWEGREYVIFPKEQIWVYYLFRPLSYADSKLTSMNFHIGPHE